MFMAQGEKLGPLDRFPIFVAQSSKDILPLPWPVGIYLLASRYSIEQLNKR
jgi:hypothetical protein